MNPEFERRLTALLCTVEVFILADCAWELGTDDGERMALELLEGIVTKEITARRSEIAASREHITNLQQQIGAFAKP